jgi:glycosyltransferase involved in cell wall biosynthesis
MRTPSVSIILPTYNRADTIERAVRSVQAQTFTDWELLVVDDGSQDGTADLLGGLGDDRIRVMRQANAGTYVARNAGLAASRGRLLTFLDSDDAWRPHFLELTTAFLRWSSDDQFVTTEFDQDYGDGHVVRHDRDGVGSQYPSFARAIGSSRLDLPAGETDAYLRVYQSREPVGAWGRDAAQAAGHPDAQLYRGRIFTHMRWGYLNWLPVTVLTRHALETIGPFTTRTRNAADFRFLGLLAKHFRANMIAIPCAVKHERAHGAQELRQGHLARGANSYTFEVNKMAYFEEMFADQFSLDPELPLVRCHYQYAAGFAALRFGDRRNALRHLGAAASWRPRLRTAYALWLLARLAPSDRWAARLLNGTLRAADVSARLLRGELSPVTAAGKLLSARSRNEAPAPAATPQAQASRL